MSVLPFRTVPAIGPRYWTAIAAASVFGANLGDFLSHILQLGHYRGLPWLALAFAAVAFGSRRGGEAWYWAAIVIVRTAATNLGDLATHDGALGYVPVSSGLAALLLAILSIRRALVGDSGLAGGLRPDTGYWAAMLTAGTLGTTLGDGLADAAGLASAALMTATAVAAVLLFRQLKVSLAMNYWLGIVAIRTCGTNVGDLTAGALTLPISTALSGLVLCGLLLAWRQRHSAAVSIRV